MSNRTNREVAAALLLILLTAPLAVRAQVPDPSRTEGAFLGARTGAYGVGYEGDRDGGGAVVGLRAGFGLSSRVTVYLGLDRVSVSEGDGFEGLPANANYTSYILDLGVRLHFRDLHRLVPFMDLGGSGLGFAFDNADGDKTSYSGPSLSLGGGALYFLTPAVALEGGAAFTVGELQEREIAGVAEDVGIRFAGMRLQLGPSFYPFN